MTVVTAEQRIVTDDPVRLLARPVAAGVKVEKSAGLSFEQALEIVKAAGGRRRGVPNPDWNEAAVVRDSRGRFAKKNSLLGALQRMYSDKPAMPITAAPTRNPLAKPGRAGQSKEMSSTVAPMATPRTSAEREAADRAAFRAAGPVGLTPAQIKNDDRITGYADRAEVKRRMVALGLSEDSAERQLVASGVPADAERMNADAYRVLVGDRAAMARLNASASPIEPKPRTLADARRERDQADAAIMRLSPGVLGNIDPADQTTLTAARARAVELDAEIAALKAAEVPAPKPDSESFQRISAKDLKPGDEMKSYVDFIPPAKVVRVRQAQQYRRVEIDVTRNGVPETLHDSESGEYHITNRPALAEPDVPPAPKRLTGAQLMGLVKDQGNGFHSYGPRDNAKRAMVAAGLSEQDADDQLTELGVAPGKELNYSIISNSEQMARDEAEARIRASTPEIFGKLLASEGGSAITHKPSRQVIEDLKANGWEATGASSIMGMLSFTSPNGESMSLHLPVHDDQKPYFMTDQRKLTFKAARERAAAGAVMPEAPKVVEVDPYAERQVMASEIQVGDEYRALDGWKRVGAIYPRKDGGIELHDGTMNWDSRISTISGPNMIGPHATWRATVRTPRPVEPVEPETPVPAAELTVEQMILNGERMYGTDRRKWPARAQADLAKLQRKERSAS
jgi:hypothetical protein